MVFLPGASHVVRVADFFSFASFAIFCSIRPLFASISSVEMLFGVLLATWAELASLLGHTLW